jgi:O-antigen ligase
VAVLAPQLILALFLFAGVTKATPWLRGLPIDLTVLTAGGVLLAMARRAAVPGGLRALPAATGFAAGLAALVVLSVLWTPGDKIGLERALRFETLTMITFTAPLVLVRSRDELKRLMVGLVALALVVALTAVQTVSASEPLVAAGSGGNEIELALYSAVGLFAAVGYLVLVDPIWRRLLWLALAGVVFIPTILAAGSRGVLTGTVLSLVVLAAFIIARSQRKGLSIAYVLLAVVLLIFAAPGLAGTAGDKYGRVLAGRSEALGQRAHLYSWGWELALAHPMGLGVGGYSAKTGFPYPHNALLEAADEEGVIGLALLVALIIAAVRAAPRGPGGATSPEAVLAVTFLILNVAESMFSDTFTQNRVFWFALGLALAVPKIVTTK